MKVGEALNWIRQRTWAKVIVTILAIVTLPLWIVPLCLVLVVGIAYEEMWGGANLLCKHLDREGAREALFFLRGMAVGMAVAAATVGVVVRAAVA